MSAKIEAQCGDCLAASIIPYKMLGARIPCPVCGSMSVFKVQIGMLYPDTGYEIRFSDFSHLVKYSGYDKVVRKFFQDRGYKILGTGDDVEFKSDAGETIELLAMHLQIQDDPLLQRELYQVAMSVWR